MVYQEFAFLNNKPDTKNNQAKKLVSKKTPKMLGDHDVSGGGQMIKAITGTSICTAAAVNKVYARPRAVNPESTEPPMMTTKVKAYK